MATNQDAIAPLIESRLFMAQFQRLAEVPPEAQWFANLDSAQTRRAYQNDLKSFMAFTGIVKPEEFRSVTRSHILAWRADLEGQKLAGSTIRRKLAALASLYEYLCETNAVTHNPVKGVKRPKVDSYEGKTPARTSPERHGAMTGIMKAQIDWIPLSLGAVRPTQGKTLAVMQVHTPKPYVRQAFRRYLECGIFAHGFARAWCDDCGHDYFVAYSCKGRGLCLSCNTRRMVETAAHLTDHVFPRLPVRQWAVWDSAPHT